MSLLCGQKVKDMLGKSPNQGPGEVHLSLEQLQQGEQILSAIALLLGPDTDYHKRARATQRLVKIGSDVLPFLLPALDSCDEIVTPVWPWWPPQYEQIGRLLIQLTQKAQISLETLLLCDDRESSPGPVLWTSVVEAAGMLPHMEHEELLRAALSSPWWTVRYAAAMAIANHAAQFPLHPETRQELHQRQRCDGELPVRLVASCALLRCVDSRGLETLLQFLETSTQSEIRKAALFILATELPTPLPLQQKQRLAILLLEALQDTDQQVALHAARAMRGVADVKTLASLTDLLEHPFPLTRIAVLTTFEELAGRKTMRSAMQHHTIMARIVQFLRTDDPELRRQACCTLAAVGGEYTIAVLGTLILDTDHPAHMEVIEALRLLPEVQQPFVLTRVVRWLLHALIQPSESTQIGAIDSLSYLVWQAQMYHRRQALNVIVQELQESGTIVQLLTSSSSWVRQRTVELLSQLDSQLYERRDILLEMLQHDGDSGVRACVIYVLGQASALWAIPDLLHALLDSDEYVVEAVLHSLGSMPLLNDAIVVYAIKELAAYRLPITLLHERSHAIHVARAWLKKRKKGKRQ